MYILCKNRSLNQSLVLMRLAVTVNLTHVCKTSVVWQVFLDEVNTSSCLGLFKEIIVDRTFDGNVSNPPCHCVLHCVVLVEHRHEKPSSPLQPIPNNVFIVAACNPHRGNSLASHRQKKTWVRGAYYVRQLHPPFTSSCGTMALWMRTRRESTSMLRWRCTTARCQKQM